jgi:hypothetical protein
MTTANIKIKVVGEEIAIDALTTTEVVVIESTASSSIPPVTMSSHYFDTVIK